MIVPEVMRTFHRQSISARGTAKQGNDRAFRESAPPTPVLGRWAG
jgi:hypothetical protein